MLCYPCPVAHGAFFVSEEIGNFTTDFEEGCRGGVAGKENHVLSCRRNVPNRLRSQLVKYLHEYQVIQNQELIHKGQSTKSFPVFREAQLALESS